MPAGVIYAVVARSSTVLSEYATTTGNFTTVAGRILQKVSTSEDSMMSYAYDGYLFSYVVSGEAGVIFLCMTDEAFSRRLAFAFLQDVKNRWVSEYGQRGKDAQPFTMDAFNKVLQRQMAYFSTNPDADRLTRVRGQIDEVKNVMVQNIDMALNRGEKIELLVNKSEDLSLQAGKFRGAATRLKRAMWWKNAKLMLLIAAIVLAAVFIITWIACGAQFQRCRSS